MTVRKGKLIRDEVYVKLFSCSEENRQIVQFTDTFYSPGSRSRPDIPSKGAMNCALGTVLYRYLASYHVRTFFIDGNRADELLVAETDPLPLAVTIRNWADDDFAARFEVKKGEMLQMPVLELHYLDKKGKPVPAPADLFLHHTSLDAAHLAEIETMSRKCNTVLRAFFERRGLLLLDCTLFWGTGSEGPLLCGGMEFEHLHLAVIPDNEKALISPVVFGRDAGPYQRLHDAVVA
ncbi:hypothetical protein JXO52_08765 [bacterium]|nr:hypothetical protein [bacterium]